MAFHGSANLQVQGTVSAPGDGADVVRRPWRFLVLAELANLPALRRQLGRARASTLTGDLAALVAAVESDTRVTVLGRTVIEVASRGDSLDVVHRLLDRLQAQFQVPVEVDGESYGLDVVLAASACPGGGVDEVRLVEEAEDALAQARSERRRIVRDATEGLAADRLSLSRDLAGAVGRGEMFLQYQPKLHVRRQQITSLEALVRWNHPRRGLILPGDFIPLAESTQAIGPLTLWTIEQVARDSRVLLEDGRDLTVFVNISGQLLSDVHFINAACALIAATGVRVGFEITETSVIRDPDMAIAHLKQIAAQGVPIAIDDYGAGLSSLAYLKKLPATELKIDKMFVMELTSSHRDPLIVRSTIDLAHAMEMEVTAEGVETPAALALLTVMGCDIVQGYLISRPVSLPALRQFLAEHTESPATLAFKPFSLPHRA